MTGLEIYLKAKPRLRGGVRVSVERVVYVPWRWSLKPCSAICLRVSSCHSGVVSLKLDSGKVVKTFERGERTS